MEERRACVENSQQEEKRQEIVERTDGADTQHKVADQLDIPALRLLDKAGINMIGWNRHLCQIIEKVVEQDLRGQHGEERQEQKRPGHAEHIPKIGTGPHEQVLNDVAEGFASLDNALVQHV